jgi:thiamine pyrophosphate-dependent acetolactate synthase large subunit-like protein
MNDCAYGAERHFLDLAGLSHRHAQFPDVDFAMLAGSLGLRAARVDSLSDLDALSETLRENLETPLLIDCKTDPALRAEWLDEL